MSKVEAVTVVVILGIVAFFGLSFWEYHRKQECLVGCELTTIGREYHAPQALGRGESFYIVHHCAKHDRDILEPVPREVWMEMRQSGVPELRLGGAE